MTTATVLDREEYVEQAYLFRTVRDRLTENQAAQDVLQRVGDELLTSTRLLIDSPAASDPRFKDLLEDLELVLAQIAMLQSGRTRQEIDLITDALEERDVVPRIRSAAARLARGD